MYGIMQVLTHDCRQRQNGNFNLAVEGTDSKAHRRGHSVSKVTSTYNITQKEPEMSDMSHMTPPLRDRDHRVKSI